MPAGRPTDYREEYCEGIVEFCAQGYSLTAYAGEIGVARQSITEWARVHPEFSVAVNRAKAVCAKWWEDRGRNVAENGGTGGQATMAIFGMKNMSSDDFRDKTEHELTGKDGGPIEHRIDAPDKETREEWLARHGMDTAIGTATRSPPGGVVR